jgi:hypothetical protein
MCTLASECEIVANIRPTSQPYLPQECMHQRGYNSAQLRAPSFGHHTHTSETGDPVDRSKPQTEVLTQHTSSSSLPGILRG